MLLRMKKQTGSESTRRVEHCTREAQKCAIGSEETKPSCKPEGGKLTHEPTSATTSARNTYKVSQKKRKRY